MKRILPIVLILVLLLSACAKVPAEYTVIVNGVELTVNTESGRIFDGTNTYVYMHIGVGAQNRINDSTTIYYPNDSTWEIEERTENGSIVSSHIATSEDYDASRYLPGETLMESIKLAKAQKAAMEAKTPQVDWPRFAVGVMCLIWGALGLIFPETMWEIGVMFKRWRYRDMDPTEEGMAAHKAGNVILLVLGVIFLVIAF